MSHKKSIPCYVPNGGEHFVVNIPMGIFTRVRLKNLCKELLQNLQTFETMIVAKATKKNVQILEGLVKILDLDYKPLANRSAAQTLLTAVEKNLKPTATSHEDEEEVNLISFSVSCGLIAVIFMLVAHLDYLQTL